jgi:hypothetical protein
MPWTCAARLFGPAPFKEFRGLQLLSLLRTILGFALSVLIYDHFRADDQQASDWASNIEFTLFISIGITIILSAIIIIRRQDFSPEALRPAGRALLALLIVGVFTLLDHLRYEYSALGLAAGIIFLWYVPFTSASAVYWYLSPFGESKKFPLLGPAVTAITASAVTVISFISGDDGPLPLLIWIGVNLTALFTSLALAAAEVHIARRDLAHRPSSARLTRRG